MRRQSFSSSAVWEPLVGYSRAVHHEFFATVRPATSMVEVSRLVSPEILVEIEADAWIDES
jgi:enamine deaminase RidA (YjgF/YER057c/UK114 family)